MPDKIVNHFVLADGSVARYDYDGLNGAPDLLEPSDNLFDISTITLGYYTNASGALVAHANSEISDYIEVDGGETYTSSQIPSNSTVYYYIATYDENKTFIERINAYYNVTRTLGDNVKYIRISFYNNHFPNHFMLVKGNFAPMAYMPYEVVQDDLLPNTNRVFVKKVNGSSIRIETGKSLHVLTLQTNTQKNLNTWRLTQGYANYNLLWNEVDVECPIKQKDVSDYMGGYHGDEQLTSVTFLADGQEIDFSTVVNGTIIECNNFTAIVVSDIYFDGDSTNKAFLRNKRLVFEDGKMQVNNTYTSVSETAIDIDVVITGLYAFSSNYVSGFSHNNSNAYITADNGARSQNLDMVSFYGTGFVANMKVLYGKSNNYSGVVYYEPQYTRYKAYFFDWWSAGTNYLTMNTGDKVSTGYEISFE